MPETVLTGNEAVARGALHSGITAAYSYPGTPATEILESIISFRGEVASPVACWSTNEKTAYEAGLGVSLAGGRVLVVMKHVGLNVAADPFVNSALTKLNGGLVLAVADDPGMHSSQNEQDSRYYADFARIICLEPSSPQEAYTMTRFAFELSETHHLPVMVRLVTRIAHGRSNITFSEIARKSTCRHGVHQQDKWVLLPSISRVLWAELVAEQHTFRELSEATQYNVLRLPEQKSGLAVITTGIARQYYLENCRGLEPVPAHLHIGMYPLPERKIRELAAHAATLLVIEEGYPFVERFLRGILPMATCIHGRMDGILPATGELSPDSVRNALNLPPRKGLPVSLHIPDRPPKFCKGCPHIDSFSVIKTVLEDFEAPLVTADIGCYSLGALPPFSLLDSNICMGASIGMAIGAADNRAWPVIAVIGDSTFLHSGMTALCDAQSRNSDITVVILDNEVVAMTGGQSTVIPSRNIAQIVTGLGVDPAHVHVQENTAAGREKNATVLKQEINHHGLSVVIMHRECVVSALRNRNSP